MKKNVLFLTLVAIFMCNTAFAQMFTTNPNAHNNPSNMVSSDSRSYFKLGLCAYEFDTEGGLGLQQSSEIQAMAKIPADMIAPYAGAQIAGINVGFSKVVSNVTVFVRETMTGANVASKTITTGNIGWNEVVFDAPLAVENKDYYIGYHIPSLPGSTYAIGYTEQSATATDALLLNVNGGDFTDYTGQFGALAIQALLSGSDEMFGNKAQLIDVTIADNQPLNSSIEVPVIFNNIGTNNISNIELTYKLGTNAAVQQTFTANITGGDTSPKTVTLTGVNINMAGDFSVTITKVNDVATTSNTITKPIAVYDPANVAVRKILLEQFTTESCGYCPAGAARIKNVMNQAEFAGKVIWVAHHAGFYTDPYTIPASESYLRFYGAGGTYAPAMMVDRTILEGAAPVMGVGGESTIANHFRKSLAVPTNFTVDITQENTVATDRGVNITVHGKNLSGATPAEDLYVFIFLLENGIVTNGQSGGGAGYIHNNLIRSVLNGVAGTKITWNGDSYSVNAEGTLPASWKEENMDVVAFVAKDYMNAINNVQVMNAERAALAMTNHTGIEDVYGSALKVYAQNGTIVVEGEYTGIQVFGIDGKEFNNRNLANGLYIVKIDNNGQKAVRKVFVK